MDVGDIPEAGRVAYLGPQLEEGACRTVRDLGYMLDILPLDAVEPDLSEEVDLLVLGIGTEHPLRAAYQAEAGRRGVAMVNDLAFLGRLEAAMKVPRDRRIVITGSAGKTVTAALLIGLLGRGGLEAEALTASSGYLNALGSGAGHLVFHVAPSSMREAASLCAGSVAVLNLSEEAGLPVGQKAREACFRILLDSSFGILGADDTATQSLLMAVRRREASTGARVVPISGGATLSDGWFALDRSVYAIRNGRTRRVAGYSASATLIGDHFGQDAAAAAALAAHFGVSDDRIAAGLVAFPGVAGRFDCIGAHGRVVFVDDRHASCPASTDAAIAACPEVLWIGRRHGRLSAKARASLKGSFFLQGGDPADPPVDGVVTFADAEGATAAALRAAEDLVRRDPGSTPVVLFSPGAPGFDRQGELFRLKVLGAAAERRAAHG